MSNTKTTETDRLYIVMPAYNEEMNIRETVAQWHEIAVRTGPESRLVVVNDGSRDRTKELLDQCRDECPRLIVLDRKNGGHGAAVLSGYRYALDCGADYIFQTDSDGQTVPEEFWQFWRDRRLCGLLIGDRRHRQDGLARLAVTRALRMALRIRFRISVKDSNTPFRLMRAGELAEILELFPEHCALPNVLMSVCYLRLGKTVRWYPVTFRPRQGGKNSLNIRRILRLGARAWREFGELDGTKRRKCKRQKDRTE